MQLMCTTQSLIDTEDMQCRFLDIQRLAEEARAAKAVIFTTLQGGSGEAGELQGFLERSLVPFTGSAWQACQLCIDKVCITSLHPLGSQAISSCFQQLRRLLLRHVKPTLIPFTGSAWQTCQLCIDKACSNPCMYLPAPFRHTSIWSALSS